MVVTADEGLYEFVKKFRNYGKFDYRVKGFNFRMNEFTAALGLIQLGELPSVLKWKRALAKKYDAVFANRLHLPEGMRSGYYKYIVFEKKLKVETGKVYGELCHELMGVAGDFPNAAFIKANHACPPIYYGWEGASLGVEVLRKKLLVDE